MAVKRKDLKRGSLLIHKDAPRSVANCIEVWLPNNDGMIQFNRQGGGFVHTVPPLRTDEFLADHTLWNSEWEQYERKVFSIWEGQDYVGWSTGQRWNGWACPELEEPDFLRFVAHINESFESDDDSCIRFEQVFGVWYEIWHECSEDRTEETRHAVTSRTIMGDIVVYDVGMSLCWNDEDIEYIWVVMYNNENHYRFFSHKSRDSAARKVLELMKASRYWNAVEDPQEYKLEHTADIMQLMAGWGEQTAYDEVFDLQKTIVLS